MSARHLLPAFVLAALVAACAPPSGEKPAQVTPQITEQVLRDRAKEQLAQGIKQYEAGDFESAFKNLTASLDHGLLSKSDQSIARKHIAFIHCVSNREVLCRDEFRKAFEINTDFALTTAEDGHPIWGPIYRNVRAQLITERDAAAAASKPRVPLAKAEQMLADGMVKYDSGDPAAAIKLFEAATKEGLKEKADQVKSLKHTAFSLCLEGKYSACRATFLKIFDVDPTFDLTPAEAGHPSWTRTYAGAKAQAQKALAEKAAKEKAAQPKSAPAAAPTAKDKAPTPPAAAQQPPKKN
ncbi:TssQ family T6SS-associated lipoprotein [Usitatibacter palustris]|uniref:Lipoprotein n=1 Tax=Usitatibacter palustris TaxID=2732487 RepID=A0A6M4H9W3_9PROT|nr:TssQ family T6SS-associated lipoprotein [Usitatibacter palustris]QJR15658.1 hypothetical protein DSM104440_02483 [Usitatibacter palustris]